MMLPMHRGNGAKPAALPVEQPTMFEWS